MGVKVDCREMKAFAQRIEALNGQRREQFFESSARKTAEHLLALVIPATPVGSAGTLQRGWTGGEGAAAYSAQMTVQNAGKGYSITVTNPVPYASFVEYGHHQTPGRFVPAIGRPLEEDWVDGRFFLRSSEEQLKASVPAILEPLLNAYLRQVL